LIVVGNYVHKVSNDVLYYAIASGSLISVFVGINATVCIYGAASASLLSSAGYSMHLGEESMSISLEDSSWILAIFLV
jgi:hypothetical protein